MIDHPIVIASEARQTSVVSRFTGLPCFARNDDGLTM